MADDAIQREAAGLPEPAQVNGITQKPWKASAWPTASPTPTPTHQTQDFEMFGNRGIYHQGWSARFGELSAALAILVGLVLVGLGVLHVGFVSRFISASVQAGFMFGLG